MYKMSCEQYSTVVEIANGLRNYGDLEDYFREYPTAVLQVRMPSGKIVTVTEGSFNGLLWNHEGGYEDEEGYDMDNFKVISVIRNNEDVNRRIREMRKRRRQPEMHGVNDVTFQIREEYILNDYYCPSNFNCLGKCIQKRLELDNRMDLWDKLKDIDFDEYSTIPQVNVAIKSKGVSLAVIDYNNKTTKFYDKFDIKVYIYKHKVELGFWHSILILNRNKYKRVKPKVEVVVERVQLEDLDDLSVLENGEKLKDFRESDDKCVRSYAYDFETYMNKDVRVGIYYKQEPYLLQWGNDRKVDYSFDLDNPYSLILQMLEFLKEELRVEDRMRKKGDYLVRRLRVFSFNGAKFDNHLFLEYMNSPEWEVKGKFLGDETVIKRFSIKCKTLPFENEVCFVDAMLFFGPGTNLEQACKTFDCKNLKFDKKDFDIKDYMTKEAILKNKEMIIEYGCQDVRALYGLMCKYDDNMRKVSGVKLSVLSCVSLANYANKVRDHNHDLNVKLYYNKRKEIADFERACVYGGRLIVGKLKCDEPLVAADANSLYPSAMWKYEYPVGKRSYFNRKLHLQKMEEYRNKLNKGEDVPLCNMKVKFRINKNCLVPMLPVKNCKDKEGLVQVGCYTIVELQEAVKYGKYEILEVLFVQEFEGKARIFQKFVDVFYNKRKEYKAKMKGLGKNSSEYRKYNVLQDLCKLLMNSSFGSLIMKSFDNVYQFVSVEKFERDYDETVSLITVTNGKYFTKYKNKCHHDNTKPIYLGAYILSYSKRIMNEYVDASDGFFSHTIVYSDTDSQYMTKDSYRLVEEKGLIGNELGQCKNDYGEGLEIVKFLCLGKKMKMCLLSNGEIKTTIKGFKGLKSLSMEEKLELFECFEKVIESGSKEVFKEISFETMKRSALQVNVIPMTRRFKMTAYDQYKIDQKFNCYPLYYDLDKDFL
jgi:DNA polymerase elongation subunit (family B)